MKLMKFNYFCMVSVMLSFFQATNAMEADPDMVPMDDAMRQYEEGDLLDPDRTKFSELKKVINKNKKSIASYTAFGSLLSGFFFKQFFIPQISEDTEYSFLELIKGHPKTSTAIVATGGGVVAGVSSTMTHIAHREQKREQLQVIKRLEANMEEIINNPGLDDVVRGIRIDQVSLLLDQAIVKFNEK